jgi:hypothetical protein
MRYTDRPPGKPAACERADRLTLGASTPGGLGANAGEGLGLSPTGKRPPRKGSLEET